jgi:hypothetical protein
VSSAEQKIETLKSLESCYLDDIVKIWIMDLQLVELVFRLADLLQTDD